MTITALDWTVLVLYLVAITAIGLVAGSRVRKSGQYFLGERKFGPWVMISQSFTVGTHAEMPVALAGAVYGIGASAIWYQWKNLFITPLYWVMAPVFRRVRRTTMAEMTADRYGSLMSAVYIVFAVCFFIIETGGLLKGAGKVISQATGESAGVNQIVAAMTVMFVLYSFVGGLVASAWTDLLQGVLIIVLSFILIPLGWTVVGGLDGMKASLTPFRFSLSTPSGIGPWVIAMLTVNGLVGIMAQPHMLAAVGTALPCQAIVPGQPVISGCAVVPRVGANDAADARQEVLAGNRCERGGAVRRCGETQRRDVRMKLGQVALRPTERPANHAGPR
jgi:Na+/proline symporter